MHGAVSDKTDHVEWVALRVEVVVGLQYVAVARGLHRYHLLLHFYMSARVFGFKNLQSIDKKQQLIEMIENANSEEIEAVLLAIGRKWKKSNSNSKSDSSINNNEYAKVS
jgi:hypothetical protein